MNLLVRRNSEAAAPSGMSDVLSGWSTSARHWRNEYKRLAFQLKYYNYNYYYYYYYYYLRERQAQIRIRK